MISICVFFIILFTLKRRFPYSDNYHLTCKSCEQSYHQSRIYRDTLTCENCFSQAASKSDHFALRGRCIDAFDDGTVDPDEL